MKLCVANNVPILHLLWLNLSIMFNFPLNPRSFDLVLHKERNFQDVHSIMKDIKKDNHEEYVREQLLVIKKNILEDAFKVLSS